MLRGYDIPNSVEMKLILCSKGHTSNNRRASASVNASLISKISLWIYTEQSDRRILPKYMAQHRGLAVVLRTLI